MDVSIYKAAILGWRLQIRDIEAKIKQVEEVIAGAAEGTTKAAPAAAAPVKKKRGMSAEGRARIAEATSKRWAEFRRIKAKAAAQIKAAAKKKKRGTTKTMKPRPQATTADPLGAEAVLAEIA